MVAVSYLFTLLIVVIHKTLSSLCLEILPDKREHLQGSFFALPENGN